MSETYNIIFSTKNANAVNTGKIHAVQYAVNWDNMLNKKYKKYNCSFTFISEASGVYGNC